MSSTSCECDCYYCSHQYYGPVPGENAPFYDTTGSPFVYYAQIPQNQRSHRRKDSSNCFVKAFRWFIQEIPKSREDPPAPQAANFASWLDSKYAQYLREANTPCRLKLTQTAVFEATECPLETPAPIVQPCEPCVRSKRFSRLKSPWKKHRPTCYEKEQGDQLKQNQKSLVYLLQPKDSRTTSDCCHPTPTSCYSETTVTKNTTVRSQSLTEIRQDADNRPIEGNKVKVKISDVKKTVCPENIIARKCKRKHVSCECFKDAQLQPKMEPEVVLLEPKMSRCSRPSCPSRTILVIDSVPNNGTPTETLLKDSGPTSPKTITKCQSKRPSFIQMQNTSCQCVIPSTPRRTSESSFKVKTNTSCQYIEEPKQSKLPLPHIQLCAKCPCPIPNICDDSCGVTTPRPPPPPPPCPLPHCYCSPNAAYSSTRGGILDLTIQPNNPQPSLPAFDAQSFQRRQAVHATSDSECPYVCPRPSACKPVSFPLPSGCSPCCKYPCPQQSNITSSLGEISSEWPKCSPYCMMQARRLSLERSSRSYTFLKNDTTQTSDTSINFNADEMATYPLYMRIYCADKLIADACYCTNEK